MIKPEHKRILTKAFESPLSDQFFWVQAQYLTISAVVVIGVSALVGLWLGAMSSFVIVSAILCALYLVFQSDRLDEMHQGLVHRGLESVYDAFVCVPDEIRDNAIAYINDSTPSQIKKQVSVNIMGDMRILFKASHE